MDSNISYKRNFIVLDEESDIFRADNQKTSTGYAKIEDRGIKTKVSIYIQDLLPDSYKVYCICLKDGKVEAVKCGELIIDKNKKAEISYETMSNKIFEKNYLPEDIMGICIISKNNTPALEGFKGEKLDYKVEEVEETESLIRDGDFEKIEAKEKDIQEEPIEELNQELSEDIKEEVKEDIEEDIKEEDTEQKDEEEIFYNIQDYYVPFENADLKTKWIRKSHLTMDNKYLKRIFSIPRLYYLCSNYKHYVIGEDTDKVIIGVPANYNNTYIYIKNNFGDSVKWVPISEQFEDYGYWLFFANKD